MTRHLVLGATGQVGRVLVAALNAREEAVATTGHTRPADHRVDLGDADAVRRILDLMEPTTCWVVGAYTHVDGCETDPERSRRVNREAPEVAAAWARRRGARVVLFSTDYVFDGTRGPYKEGDPIAPLSVYGRDKAAAEAAVTAVPGGLVLRTAWVYSWEPEPAQNFCQRLVGNLGAGNAARVPADQWGNPTYAPDLASIACALNAEEAQGIWHVAGSAVVTRYLFAQAIAQAFGLSQDLVEGVATRDLGQRAPRPLQGGLLMGRLEAVGASIPRPPDEVLPLLAASHPVAGR